MEGEADWLLQIDQIGSGVNVCVPVCLHARGVSRQMVVTIQFILGALLSFCLTRHQSRCLRLPSRAHFFFFCTALEYLKRLQSNLLMERNKSDEQLDVSAWHSECRGSGLKNTHQILFIRNIMHLENINRGDIYVLQPISFLKCSSIMSIRIICFYSSLFVTHVFSQKAH